ncbi:MAG: S8 family peptidase [Bacteroidales bacterium]
MYKYLLLLTGLLLLLTPVTAQQIADSTYWVYFTDKENNGYSIDRPEDFLTPSSVERRAWQGLAIDETDLPVTGTYLEELRSMGVNIRHISRWLNGVAMTEMDSLLFEQVLSRQFADTVPWKPCLNGTYLLPAPSGDRFEPPMEDPPGYDYGYSANQVRMLNMQVLHGKGYTGRGVHIAVMDAGFHNVDSLPSFVSMISEGRLLGTRNFVNDRPLFRQGSTHGMYVLSVIGADLNGYLMGTAPHASYFLCMTENPGQETRIEEIAWIEAAEYIDSLGFDVINTSLGYSDFDSTLWDYTYRDMDGKSTFISRAASMTSGKGIIAVNSAGNEGAKDWYYITAPADAMDVLAIGAVDSMKLIAGFSSRGPSFDARIKPDVTAMGLATVVQGTSGGLASGGGTSFSSPLVTGSVASLWQAYPQVPASELIHMIRQSGDRVKNPDSTYGFGVPDFALAYWTISTVPARFIPGHLEIYPNPASRRIMIKLPEEITGHFELRYYDLRGRVAYTQQVFLPGEVILPDRLNTGMYILEIRTHGGVYRSRLIKN